jgi:hypothetical protein
LDTSDRAGEEQPEAGIKLCGRSELLKAAQRNKNIRTRYCRHAAAARSSLSAPRATILRASSGNGRCSALASFHGAGMQTSHSSGVRQDDRGFGFDLVPRSPLNSVQSPPKANRGRSSLSANQTTSFFLVSGFGSGAYSAKLFSHASAGTCGRSQAPGAGQRQNAERGRGKPRRECREHRDADEGFMRSKLKGQIDRTLALTP